MLGVSDESREGGGVGSRSGIKGNRGGHVAKVDRLSVRS